jgi:methyl-accepting chemotaxis protein
MTAGPRRRRSLGLALAAFGLAGLLLTVAAATLVLGSLGALAGVAASLDRQRAELVDLIEPAAAALNRSADSAANASLSLTASAAAAEDAATLTTQLADSMDGMSQAASFQVFGTQPFGAAAASLAQVAASSRTLSSDLHTTAASISGNVNDSISVAASLRDLARQLEAIGRSASAAGSASTLSASALDFGRVVLLGLLAWLAIPALVTIWLGIRLWRGWWPRGSSTEGQTAGS